MVVIEKIAALAMKKASEQGEGVRLFSQSQDIKRLLRNLEGNMENLKEHNQKVKDYLNSGRNSEKKIRFVESQIQELEMSKKYPSLSGDGMPHGSSQKDLSDYIVAKERLQDKLLRIRTKEMERKNDILAKLELMDADEAAVLRMFHLERMRVKDIAKEIGYSESHIHRIHSRGLKNFEIEEEDNEQINI